MDSVANDFTKADNQPINQLPGEHVAEQTHPSPWWHLLPLPGGLSDEILDRIDRELQRQDVQEQLQALADSGTYPAQVIARLRELGFPRLFAEPARATAWHLTALNEVTARADGSLTISVGIHGLGLLPVWIAGSAAQKAHVARRINEGSGASLLLSELANGSNLARNEMRADAGFLRDGSFHPIASAQEVPTHYRLRGEKHLINGATQHRLLVVLARTREADPSRPGPMGSLADFSLFLVDRDEDAGVAEALTSLPRWRTSPVQGADISGARFDDLCLPSARMIGERGQGLLTVNRALVISRGGVGAFAAGTAARAQAMALNYARTRNIYGEPIVNLDAIAAHALRADLAATASAALSLKIAAAANALGQGAASLAAAAKFACCVLAEEAVTEGRRILGARALLRDHPFERLVRDVVVFGAFDGSSHLMLDQLSNRLAQASREPRESNVDLRQLGAIYREPACPLTEVLARRVAQPRLDLVGRARALASAGGVDASALVALSTALLDVVAALNRSGLWEDQSNRFHAGLTLGFMEALMASLELCDGERRQAMGLSAANLGDDDLRRCGLLLAWLGGRVLRRIRALALSCELAECVRPLEGVEEGIRAREGELSRAYRASLKIATT